MADVAATTRRERITVEPESMWPYALGVAIALILGVALGLLYQWGTP